jgi:hypothetical protein
MFGNEGEGLLQACISSSEIKKRLDTALKRLKRRLFNKKTLKRRFDQ